MYEHKKFYLSSFVSLLLIIGIGIVYNYYNILEMKFILKPIPILILIVNIIIYFIIYRLNIYALLCLMVLLFCLLGDILLMFYIPSIPEYNNKLFLLIGGFSFFIARLIVSINFYIYPYSSNRCYMIYNKFRIIITLFISIIYTVLVGVIFVIKIQNVMMKIFVSFYILLTGFQLFSSMMRINGFKDEDLLPQLLGVFFTLFFNISDIILFWNIFLTPILFGESISICLYWLSMYLLTISVVRNKIYSIETDNYLFLK